jgi:hypothetical protein
VFENDSLSHFNACRIQKYMLYTRSGCLEVSHILVKFKVVEKNRRELAAFAGNQKTKSVHEQSTASESKPAARQPTTPSMVWQL